MKRTRRVILVAVFATMVFGLGTLLSTPSVASNKCPQGCQPIKKHNGFPCQFAGCDPVTNACLYAC